MERIYSAPREQMFLPSVCSLGESIQESHVPRGLCRHKLSLCNADPSSPGGQRGPAKTSDTGTTGLEIPPGGGRRTRRLRYAMAAKNLRCRLSRGEWLNQFHMTSVIT